MIITKTEKKDLLSWSLPTAPKNENISTIAAPPKEKRKKNTNLETCFACGDAVTMLPRKDMKLAWIEDSVKIHKSKRLLYWCQECAETTDIEQQILQVGKKR